MSDSASTATKPLNLLVEFGLHWVQPGPTPLYLAAAAPDSTGLYELGMPAAVEGGFEPIFLGVAQARGLRHHLSQHYRHSLAGALQLSAPLLWFRYVEVADPQLLCRLRTLSLGGELVYPAMGPESWAQHWQ